MNYSEVKSLALGYADRSDTATSDRVDDFLKIVEARVNKKLKTQGMESRSSTPCVADQLLYDLPADFTGFREVLVTSGTAKKTGTLVTPERMAALQNTPEASTIPDSDSFSYLIIADQLQIYPSQADTSTLDLVYYKRVPALTSSATENWLSTDNPDCYVFGLVVEISVFVKDAPAAAAWDTRFENSMLDIKTDDAKNRWSGTPMQVRTA